MKIIVFKCVIFFNKLMLNFIQIINVKRHTNYNGFQVEVDKREVYQFAAILKKRKHTIKKF